MTLSKSLSILLLATGVSYGSTLAVYQDKTFYNFTPQNNFIGFSQGATAKCEGKTIALTPMISCPEDNRLCKTLTSLKATTLELGTIQSNIKMLDQLVLLPKPTTFDAASWISAAKLLSEEQTSLFSKKELLKKELDHQKEGFQKQAPTQDALQSMTVCATELELSIPYAHVTFFTNYEANIIDDKEVTVTQNLSIVNRSGIDIEADTAMFYYRSAQQYVHPIHFNPWVVSKYVPRVYKKSKLRKKASRAMMTEAAGMGMMDENGGDIASIEEVMASYEDAREYKIQNLTLPSTGMPLEVKVLSWKAALTCEVQAYPYANTKAFHVCSFEPKYQVESNRWKITSDTVVINESAVGEYRDDKYSLYTKIEEDINIIRKPIVQKERETGIFGGTARKKDGFTLTLTNKSAKEKTLTLIERIPTSTTDEIKAKLLSIKSKDKVNYKMLKDGKIEMKISLAGNETKKIEVLFEISYDKDLKVNY